MVAIKYAAVSIFLGGELFFGSLPYHAFYFWGFWILLIEREIGRPIIGGMPEPNRKSSDWYLWAWKSGHLSARIPGIHLLRKKLWMHLEDIAEPPEKRPEDRQS